MRAVGLKLQRTTAALHGALGATIAEALAEEAVVEVMVNPDGSIWIDRIGHGRSLSGERMAPHDAETILRLLADHAGVVVTAAEPLVSATLPQTGERFQGVFPPIVPSAAFTIRKRPAVIFSLDDYIRREILSPQTAVALRAALEARHNILVIGGTGSGKTTLTNALLAEPAIAQDRVVIIEDTAELQCAATDCVSMLTKTSAPPVTAADLARATLRLRPDRIIVGEVRDGAAMAEMLKLWNTGHPGGIGTLHANSAQEALYRVEDLLGEVMAQIPHRQIGSTINTIVRIRRSSEAKAGRVVDKPVEVLGYKDGKYALN